MRQPNPLMSHQAQAFLAGTPWRAARAERLAGDASVRGYWRLYRGAQTAVLMDASAVPACLPPFVQLAHHLRQLGLSAPDVWEADYQAGCALVEDFGDDTFARLLEGGANLEELLALGVEVLIALHQQPNAAPDSWREYHPQQMLSDIELYLDWAAGRVDEEARAQFRRRWLEILPRALQVPSSLLLRDYHAANLMLLPGRSGVRRAGLIDFQDAYRGPVTYDLMSLLEDARRDVPPGLRQRMVERYWAAFPALDQAAFQESFAILAAQRHVRVLAIFARLAARDGKPDYQARHAPRVRKLLAQALEHPALAGVREWFATYGNHD